MLKDEGKGSIYKTPAALGKARCRVMRALPGDPQMAQEVVDDIRKMLDKKVGAKEEEVVEELSPNANVRVEQRNKIIAFFYRQDISYTFPGRKFNGLSPFLTHTQTDRHQFL